MNVKNSQNAFKWPFSPAMGTGGLGYSYIKPTTNKFGKNESWYLEYFGGTSTITGSSLVVDSTDSLRLPVGTTAQRPASPSIGQYRFNSTSGTLEVYTGGEWNAGADFTTIAADAFSGDASTVAFTLSVEGTTATTIVALNGVVQIPTTAYAVSGTTLTFTEAPASGDAIEVRQITATTTVTSLTNGVGNSIIVDANGVAQFATIQSLQLPIYTVTQANALANKAAGQLIYVSNGDGGSPSLAVYNGSNWQKVVFGGAISAA